MGDFSHFLTTVSLILLVGCALDEPSELSSEIANTQQSIVRGEISSDQAVVALMHHGQHFCTGTLVAKRIVVTAAHCLPPYINIPQSEIRVFFGGSLQSGEGQHFSVVDALANPNWTPSQVQNDIGVLALNADAPVLPLPMAFMNAAFANMQDGRVIGYGITSAAAHDNGRRRTGLVQIQSTEASSFTLAAGPSLTCNGDSGGPLLAMQNGKERLVGINSRSDCKQHFLAERIDVHTMNFIMPFIEEHEGAVSCQADGMCASNCNAPDPDCLCQADGMCTTACINQEADVDCMQDIAQQESTDDDFPEVVATTSAGCSTGGSKTGWGIVLILLFWSRRLRTKKPQTLSQQTFSQRGNCYL